MEPASEHNLVLDGRQPKITFTSQHKVAIHQLRRSYNMISKIIKLQTPRLYSSEVISGKASANGPLGAQATRSK